MLSPGGARGVEKAELNGNVDSDNNHGGSSRTYVLHRARCSQEDDQLLRQGYERSGSPGRQGWGNAMGTGRLDQLRDRSSPLSRDTKEPDFDGGCFDAFAWHGRKQTSFELKRRVVGRRRPQGSPTVSVAVCSELFRRNPRIPEALVQTGVRGGR